MLYVKCLGAEAQDEKPALPPGLKPQWLAAGYVPVNLQEREGFVSFAARADLHACC